MFKGLVCSSMGGQSRLDVRVKVRVDMTSFVAGGAVGVVILMFAYVWYHVEVA